MVSFAVWWNLHGSMAWVDTWLCFVYDFYLTLLEGLILFLFGLFNFGEFLVLVIFFWCMFLVCFGPFASLTSIFWYVFYCWFYLKTSLLFFENILFSFVGSFCLRPRISGTIQLVSWQAGGDLVLFSGRVGSWWDEILFCCFCRFCFFIDFHRFS